jgi:hypothetical protein
MRLVMNDGTIHHVKAGTNVAFTREKGHATRVRFTSRSGNKEVVKAMNVKTFDHKRGNKE